MSEEDEIQITIVEGLELALPHGWIVQHTANNPRSAAAGQREKRKGAKAGWPDILILGPYPQVNSFMEVKRPKGRVEPHQKDLHDRLRDLGFNVAVVRSWKDALAAAREWGLPLKIVGAAA
jgi:hypothetical protein